MVAIGWTRQQRGPWQADLLRGPFAALPVATAQEWPISTDDAPPTYLSWDMGIPSRGSHIRLFATERKKSHLAAHSATLCQACRGYCERKDASH
jgi:hypothetical protein